MTVHVIGIDPGPATGIFTLAWHEGGDTYPPWIAGSAYQCNADAAPGLVDWLLSREHIPVSGAWDAGGIEEFRRGNIKGKRAHAGVTADLVEKLTAVARNRGLVLSCRPAVTVKRWGSDTRLAAAGLLDITSGLPHARDGARHALYAAVYSAGVPDPLSRKARADARKVEDPVIPDA